MVTTFRKWFMIVLSLFIIMFFVILVHQPTTYSKVYASFADQIVDGGNNVIKVPGNAASSDYVQLKRGEFADSQIKKLSKLGQILFLGYDPPHVDTSKKYTILIWKHGPVLERRHIKHYSKQRFDPFEHCSVKNCHLTYKNEDLNSADLVLFHLHQTKGVDQLPNGTRNPNQFWTFLTDESPYHTFMYSKNNTMNNYDGIFNWSMTYRMDSDIPVPYGRTVSLKSAEKGVEESVDEWNENKKQDVLVAIMGSNCGGRNNRWKYVNQLEKYIPIDKYGGCGTLKCPGHFTKDCGEISKYKFYLSFENSNCDEYITEKLWWNGYAKNTIPIVMGSTKQIYNQLLPPNSYINVDDFASPRDLANYILYLNKTPSELEQYLAWKKYFRVLNEHGYFGTNSVHYCRICEALNYNSKQSKVYSNLNQFWSKNDCHESWDTQIMAAGDDVTGSSKRMNPVSRHLERSKLNISEPSSQTLFKMRCYGVNSFCPPSDVITSRH